MRHGVKVRQLVQGYVSSCASTLSWIVYVQWAGSDLFLDRGCSLNSCRVFKVPPKIAAMSSSDKGKDIFDPAQVAQVHTPTLFAKASSGNRARSQILPRNKEKGPGPATRVSYSFEDPARHRQDSDKPRGDPLPRAVSLCNVLM
jgi:hypothetical protein